MCQFVAIKPSCGCVMKRRSDSDGCLERERWARSGKMWLIFVQQAGCTVRTHGSTWTLKGRSVVVVVRGCVSDKQDIDSTRRRSRTHRNVIVCLFVLFLLQYLIFSGGRDVCLRSAPWSDGSLAGTEKATVHRSGRSKKKWEKYQKPSIRKIFLAVISSTCDRVHCQRWSDIYCPESSFVVIVNSL